MNIGLVLETTHTHRLIEMVFKHVLSFIISVFILINPVRYKKSNIPAKQRIKVIVIPVLKMLFKDLTGIHCKEVEREIDGHLNNNDAGVLFSVSYSLKKGKSGYELIRPSEKSLQDYYKVKGRPIQALV